MRLSRRRELRRGHKADSILLQNARHLAARRYIEGTLRRFIPREMSDHPTITIGESALAAFEHLVHHSGVGKSAGA